MTDKDDKLDSHDVIPIVDSIMLIVNTVWRTSSVSDEPKVQLRAWGVKTDIEGNHYLIGIRVDDGYARFSTPIVELDPKRGYGRTQSGRIYDLVGPAGTSPKAEYLWTLYKAYNDIVEAEG